MPADDTNALTPAARVAVQNLRSSKTTELPNFFEGLAPLISSELKHTLLADYADDLTEFCWLSLKDDEKRQAG